MLEIHRRYPPNWFLAALLCLPVSIFSTAAQPNCATLIGPSPSSNQAYGETSRFQSPNRFIETLVPFLKKTSIGDVEFEGIPFSTAQFKALARFSTSANKPLQKGDKIRAVRLEELKHEVSTEIGIQRLNPNGAFEENLLNDSNIDVSPKEVLTFRLMKLDGTMVGTTIKITGDINSVNFDKGVDQLYQFLRGNVSEIAGIEVAHTHPTYSVNIQSKDGRSKFRSNEVSAGDYVAATTLARRMPRGMVVIVKAILPNGFNYQVDIPGGR